VGAATFLQISDLHLGAPLGWLPPELRDERRREQRAVLRDAVRIAIERGVDAILVPGDLFDGEGVDADTLAFAAAAFADPACPPVLVAPGNHDPFSESSPYWSTRLMAARGLAWPACVHVFEGPHWSARELPCGVTVWGRAFSAGMDSTERPLAVRPATADGTTHLALFHGSREGRLPPGQRIAGPFSDGEVHESPFHYLAVGHYHARSEIRRDPSPDSPVRLAYAGSAAAVSMSELGVHGALLVGLDLKGGGARIEPLDLDPRRVHDLSVDVSGISSIEQIEERAIERLDAAGAARNDFATLRLAGRIGRGVRFTGIGAALRARIAHVKMDMGRVRPDYDLDAYRNRLIETTEDQFVSALLDRLEATTDEDERLVIERALDYGLDAFRLREVAPVHEEIAS